MPLITDSKLEKVFLHKSKHKLVSNLIRRIGSKCSRIFSSNVGMCPVLHSQGWWVLSQLQGDLPKENNERTSKPLESLCKLSCF